MILAHYFIAQTQHLYGLGLGFRLAKFFCKTRLFIYCCLKKHIVFYFLNQILNQIIMIVFA